MRFTHTRARVHAQDFDEAPDLGVVEAVRHVGVNLNDHGFDHNAQFPAGEPFSTNWLHADGEFESAVKGADGSWIWMARYNLGSFDTAVGVEQPTIAAAGGLAHPYFM